MYPFVINEFSLEIDDIKMRINGTTQINARNAKMDAEAIAKTFSPRDRIVFIILHPRTMHHLG
ncbi:MAG: hypothetical protein ACD_35C00156G0003 [uncultured bacterium]|nr:MAG: hypothetical protein ACD_35C00156G0003 [uncultured bacterium]